MSLFKKNSNVVYRLKPREQGCIEGILAQQKMAEQLYLGILKGIMENAGFKQEGVEFDPTQMAFVKSTKQSQ